MTIWVIYHFLSLFYAKILVMCHFPLTHLLLHPSSLAILQGGSFEPASVKIERFLTAMDEMALPRFEVSDIEQVRYVFMDIILRFCGKI